MDKHIAIALTLAFSFLLAGCLQEKQLNQQAQSPTTGLAVSTSTPTATVSTTPRPTATASATPTPSATSTPSPTVEQGGSCAITTPQNRDSFSKSSALQVLVSFTDLPLSIKTATVKCDFAETGNTMDITRSSSGATYLTKSCSYSTARSYTISITAGGATCARTVTMTD